MERDAASVWRNSRAVAHYMSAVTMNIKNAVLMNIAELLMYKVSTARRFHFFREKLPPSPLRPLTEPLAWPAAPRIKRLGRQPSTGMLVLTIAQPAWCRAGVFQAFA